jgi:hypothetical protein
MATMVWESNRERATQVMAPAAPPRKSSTQDKFEAVRDTLAVLVVQIVFRAMLLLRRWNY